MFANTYQNGFLSILYSIGSKPLQIWASTVKNGYIKRITDQDICSSVIEIMSTNVSTTFISSPPQKNKTLAIKLPFLVMIIKNLKKYFTFEVTVLDDKGIKRRFRASNYQKTTKVMPFICTMPMRLDEGWNQIQFNLSDFTRRAYGTNYVETLKIQVHANCRIRRIYFCDRLYSEEELPPQYKLFMPNDNKNKQANNTENNAVNMNKGDNDNNNEYEEHDDIEEIEHNEENYEHNEYGNDHEDNDGIDHNEEEEEIEANDENNDSNAVIENEEKNNADN